MTALRVLPARKVLPVQLLGRLDLPGRRAILGLLDLRAQIALWLVLLDLQVLRAFRGMLARQVLKVFKAYRVSKVKLDPPGLRVTKAFRAFRASRAFRVRQALKGTPGRPVRPEPIALLLGRLARLALRGTPGRQALRANRV